MLFIIEIVVCCCKVFAYLLVNSFDFCIYSRAFAFRGLPELTEFFNHPGRSDYRVYADEGLTGAAIGLPRAYGLFHEASGLSVLVG